MEPQKARNGSPSRGSARHDSTTSSSNFTHSGFTSQPSLPSIRQLHPYLPPSGLSQHLGEGPSIMYSLPQSSSPVQSILGSRKSSEILAIDSEPDVVEQSCEPPKKKRRRQALSCTECKRRKIKCDRTQPCAPCTRRGEQSRCQWHVIEPIEKYVTRAEFDDLKARYDELFEQVQRLQAGTPAPSFNHMGMPTGLPGAVGEAVPTTSPLGYPPIISPSQPLNPSTEIQSSQRFMKPEDTQPQSRQHLNTVATSLALTRSPPSVRQPPSDHSPTSSVAKTSPFSLASIISPSNADPRSKNCYAQTLVLGKRLRPESQDLYVPAVYFSGMILRTYHLSQGRHRGHILITSRLPVKRTRRTRRIHHLEGSWSRHFKQACYHETIARSL